MSREECSARWSHGVLEEEKRSRVRRSGMRRRRTDLRNVPKAENEKELFGE